MKPLLGILPCAGEQTRMKELVFSKELLPLFDGRPVIRHSLDCLRPAVTHIRALVHPKKRDLIKYLRGQAVDVIIGTSPGLPASIVRAAGTGSSILFCLPDTYYEPTDVFLRLAQNRHANVLGLFNSGTPAHFDSVVLQHGRIIRYAVKVDPPLSSWTMGCGKLDQTALRLLATPPRKPGETIFGHLIQPLIKQGHLYGVKLPRSRYFDLGTPANYITYLLHRYPLPNRKTKTGYNQTNKL